MKKCLNIFFYVTGDECQKKFDELTTEKKIEKEVVVKVEPKVEESSTKSKSSKNNKVKEESPKSKPKPSNNTKSSSEKEKPPEEKEKKPTQNADYRNYRNRGLSTPSSSTSSDTGYHTALSESISISTASERNFNTPSFSSGTPSPFDNTAFSQYNHVPSTPSLQFSLPPPTHQNPPLQRPPLSHLPQTLPPANHISLPRLPMPHPNLPMPFHMPTPPLPHNLPPPNCPPPNCPPPNCPPPNCPRLNCPPLNCPPLNCPPLNCPPLNCPRLNCPPRNCPPPNCPPPNCPPPNCPPPNHHPPPPNCPPPNHHPPPLPPMPPMGGHHPAMRPHWNNWSDNMMRPGMGPHHPQRWDSPDKIMHPGMMGHPLPKSTPTWAPQPPLDQSGPLRIPPPQLSPAIPGVSPVDISQSSQILDLDTRIEMLLKDRTTGKINPPFLKIMSDSGDSDDDAKKSPSRRKKNRDAIREKLKQGLCGGDPLITIDKIKSLQDLLEEPLSPLSQPPSPFLSEDIYLHWYRKGIEQTRQARNRDMSLLSNNIGLSNDDIHSEISSSEDEILTRKSPLDKSLLNTEDGLVHQSTPLQDEIDDRMSLSSLSSGDEKIVEMSIHTPYPQHQHHPPHHIPPHHPLHPPLLPPHQLPPHMAGPPPRMYPNVPPPPIPNMSYPPFHHHFQQQPHFPQMQPHHQHQHPPFHPQNFEQQHPNMFWQQRPPMQQLPPGPYPVYNMPPSYPQYIAPSLPDIRPPFHMRPPMHGPGPQDHMHFQNYPESVPQSPAPEQPPTRPYAPLIK